jgi:hypothetical protein
MMINHHWSSLIIHHASLTMKHMGLCDNLKIGCSKYIQVPHSIQWHIIILPIYGVKRHPSFFRQTQMFQNSKKHVSNNPNDKNQGPSWFCDTRFQKFIRFRHPFSKWSVFQSYGDEQFIAMAMTKFHQVQASSVCLDICFSSLIRCCGSLSVLVRVPQGAPRVPQVPHLDPGRGWGWMNWDEGEWHFLKLDLVDSLALVVERTLHPNHPTVDDRNRVIFFLGGLVWNHEPAMTMTPGKIRADEKWPGSNPTWSSWPVHQQAITGNHRKPSSIVTHHNGSSLNSSLALILKNIL